MSIETFGETAVLFVPSEGATLSSEQDALDLLGQTHGLEVDMIAVPVGRFAPGFFDLSTKQAGHFFQKLQNYRMRLAIVGDIAAHTATSGALRDFVGETNRVGHHLFVADKATLAAALQGGR